MCSWKKHIQTPAMSSIVEDDDDSYEQELAKRNATNEQIISQIQGVLIFVYTRTHYITYFISITMNY